MTDQLESDLRTLLARHAAAIRPDAAGGEQAVARRLEAGDTAVAEVISLDPPRRRAWLAAAAVLVVAAVGAAVALQDRDASVVTSEPDPTETPTGFFEGEGSATDVAALYLIDRLALDPGFVLEPLVPEAGDPADLVGVSWELSHPAPSESGGVVVLRELGGERWDVVESYSDGASIDSLELTADHVLVHATGRGMLNLSLHALDGSNSGSTSSSFCGVGTAIGGPADTTTTEAELIDCDAEFEVDLDLLPATVRLVVTDADGSPLMLEERIIDDSLGDSGSDPGTGTTVRTAPPTDGPTVGEPFDSAKDVAERVAREVFGEEYVTIAATDEGALTLVTLEGEGGELIAEVAYDTVLDRERLIRIRPATGPDQIGVIGTEGGLVFEPPESGALSYSVFDAQLVELQGGSKPDVDADSTSPVGPIDDMATWIWVRLETPDGRILHWFDGR